MRKHLPVTVGVEPDQVSRLDRVARAAKRSRSSLMRYLMDIGLSFYERAPVERAPVGIRRGRCGS